MSIVRALPRFDGRSRFSTWAHRIAVNASLDELRRRRRRADPGLPGDPDVSARLPAGTVEHEPVATTADPEGAALAADVDAALRRLPPEFRAPVVLRDLCGLDYAEIADVLDLPPGTVSSRISRGRAALAPLLGPERPHRAGSPAPERPHRAGSPAPERPHRAGSPAPEPPSQEGSPASNEAPGNPMDPSGRPTP